MSTLRHPNIVQFMGICSLPSSRMPAMVMEKMVTSLHGVLDPEPSPDPTPRTEPFIPDSLKCSILHNVASGISFLQNREPPIIHRDLSAKNILLNEGMMAKIADLGMARVIPAYRAALMTKAPGALIYMPPEALEDKSIYDVKIDIFSIGVVALFILSQMFPVPLPATYMDGNGKMASRTELERRSNYMQRVLDQFEEGHPFVLLIKQCLNNQKSERPTIKRVLEHLEQARAEFEDDGNKLSLLQALHGKTKELVAKNEELGARDDLNALLLHQNEIQKEQLEYHQAHAKRLEEEVNYLHREMEKLRQLPKVSCR